MNNFEDFIINCNYLLRKILNHKISTRDFEKHKKILKIQDWNSICSVMDVIDNTELAKKNFYKFGISGPTKFNDTGESFIRLYGILNAMYLQYNCIKEIVEISKIKNKNKIIEKFSNLDIYKLRNKLASHTTNYRDDDGKKTSFQYSTWNLDGEIMIMNDGIEKFEIRKCLLEFDTLFRDIFYNSVDKYISIVYGKSIPKEIINDFNLIKEEFNGNKVIRNYSGYEPLIIKFTTT